MEYMPIMFIADDVWEYQTKTGAVYRSQWVLQNGHFMRETPWLSRSGVVEPDKEECKEADKAVKQALQERAQTDLAKRLWSVW